MSFLDLFPFGFSFLPNSFLYHNKNIHHLGVLNLHNQISSKWILIQNRRTVVNWRYMINKASEDRITLSPFQILNQIAQFNSWKLIVVRWTLHQHNINAITMHFEYLNWQFNSMSEWHLIFKLATLWVK